MAINLISKVLSNNQINKLPPEIGKLTNLRQLVLSDNQLDELPPEIEKLVNLQHLGLSSNQLNQLPIKISQLTTLQSLNLNANKLDKVPSEIFELISLQQLYLGWNQLTEIPPEIGQLLNIRRLSFSQNQLNKLPPEIFQLSNLNWLNLGSNQLSEMPSEIAKLSNLQELYLGFNQLSKLSPEIIQLSNLQSLVLRKNQFSRVPPEIIQLSNLQQLDFGRNQLGEIPVEIEQLSNLQELNLHSNRLHELPIEIFKLTNLQQLSLSSNHLTVLPSEIRNLSNLEVLSLSNNELRELPPSISDCRNIVQLDISSNRFKVIPIQILKLKKLEQFSASTNQITTIPEQLNSLQNLKVLRLGVRSLTILRNSAIFNPGNKITSVPDTFTFPNLEELELANNKIIALPSLLRELKSLKVIDLRGNPIPIPPEILGPKEIWKDPGNLNKILDYYFQTLDPNESAPLYESKFIIVGEGGAGKTTLAKKLLDPDYDLDSDEKTTEGIDVLQWEFNQSNGTPFCTNIWDFGGQEIYHATHQFFLTKRSLYVLVIDARQDNTDFYYWLNVVSLLSDSSPIFIIKNEKQDRQCDVNERLLRAEFTNLEKVFATNLADNRGLEAIKDAIQKRIVNLPHVGTPLPKVWVRVRAALENYAATCNYITVDEYCQLCCTSQLTDPDRQRNLSNYLHDLGVILHFHQDPILKHYVILKPEWGTAAVYEALDTPAIRDNFGRFTRTQLDVVWNKGEYTNMCDELLQLMMRFKLCYEIPGCPDHYIAPQLLSPEQPEFKWNSSRNLTLRYRYDFMPKGILTRLIVELHEYIENQILVWKTGVVLTNGDAHAEVTEHYPKSEIRIRVSGNDQKRWLSVIRHELEKIHRSYERLQYKTLIPCNCSTCKAKLAPHDYSYERLQQFLYDGQYQIQCQESYAMVDVHSLIDNILYTSSPPESHVVWRPGTYGENSWAPLQNTSSILNSAQKQIFQPTKEVFISYAWGGDSEDITNKVDEALKAAKINLVRDKRDLGFKGRIKDFMKQIGQGKAVVVIISDKYLKSENCMFELVEIAANDSFCDRIFPIVLEDAQIYKPIKRIRYIQHWEKEKKELDEAMNTVGNEYLQGFRDSIDLYTQIRNTIAELTETLKDMNTLTSDIHADSGFAELISGIKKRLES